MVFQSGDLSKLQSPKKLPDRNRFKGVDPIARAYWAHDKHLTTLRNHTAAFTFYGIE